MTPPMATIVPAPAVDVELARLKDQAAKIWHDAKDLAVTSNDERDFVVAFLAEIATAKKAAEARRVALVKPHNDEVATTNRFVKDLLAPVEAADKLLRDRVLAYNREQERKAEAARRAIEAERLRLEAEAERQRKEAERLAVEAATLEAQGQTAQAAATLDAAVATEAAAHVTQGEAVKPVIAPAPVARTVNTGMGRSAVTKRWTYEEINLSFVPRKYLILSPALVREDISAGVREIPGLRIYQVEGLSVSGGR